MLALLVHVPGGRVRFHVALGAGVGFTGDLDGERVARMSGRAGTEAAVRVDASNTHVRPTGQVRDLDLSEKIRIDGLHTPYLDPRTVTPEAGLAKSVTAGDGGLEFAVHPRFVAQDGVGEGHVKGIVNEVPVGHGLFGSAVLSGLHSVASRTIHR